MRCPACRTINLKRDTYEGVNVDKCPQCLGHLIPRLRSEGIQRRSKLSQEDLTTQVMLDRGEDTQKLLGCPRCGERMRKVNKARPTRFQIDLCRECDLLWLDGGELALLQLAYEDSAQGRESREMQRRHEEMSQERKRQLHNNMKQLPKPSFQRGVFGEIFDALSDSDW